MEDPRDEADQIDTESYDFGGIEEFEPSIDDELVVHGSGY